MMTKEQVRDSLLMCFALFKQQGAEVVYGVRAQERFFIGLQPADRVRGSSETPQNRELRSEEDVRAWVNE